MMRQTDVSNELTQFLQEGIASYAPASLAIAEFETQVRLRLQNVLDDFSEKFETLGLDITSLNEFASTVEELKIDSKVAYVGFRKNYSSGLFAKYWVEWNLDNREGEQLYVYALLYAGPKRPNRERLYKALTTIKLATQCHLEQASDGSACIYSYCPTDKFYNFGENFRDLIEEWCGLLTAMGGVRQFCSPAPNVDS